MEEFFGRIFWEDFFWESFGRIFFGEIFLGRNFLEGTFWEELFVYIVKVIWIWKGLICLSRFCLKAEFWQTNLVCLLEFWFVCQNFGLFVSILVCLPAFWFVCQHFGLFASILVNQIADKQTKMPTNNTTWQTKKKFRSLEVRAELTCT